MCSSLMTIPTAGESRPFFMITVDALAVRRLDGGFDFGTALSPGGCCPPDDVRTAAAAVVDADADDDDNDDDDAAAIAVV